VNKFQVDAMSDSELAEYVETGRACMKLLQERTQIELHFTLTRQMPEFAPNSTASGPFWPDWKKSVDELEIGDVLEANMSICCHQYGVRELYAFPSDDFSKHVEAAFANMTGSWCDAEAVLRGRSCLKQLFGTRVVNSDDRTRTVLEYEAGAYSVLDALFATGDFCLAYTGPHDGILAFGAEQLHLFKISGLPKMCPRPEYDLRLNALMPKFKEVVVGMLKS
jgi:hypothetical protein